MSRARSRIFLSLSLATLGLACAGVVLSPGTSWAGLAFPGAAILALVSAALLAHAWDVGMLGALLFCVGATISAGTQGALVRASQMETLEVDWVKEPPVPERENPLRYRWHDDEMTLDEGRERVRLGPPSPEVLRLFFENALRDLGQVEREVLPVIDSPSYRQGVADARRDVAAGTLRVYNHEGMMHVPESYDRIMLEVYGIENEWIGCMVSYELLDHMQGYNNVMYLAIQAEHGDGVFARSIALTRQTLDEEILKEAALYEDAPDEAALDEGE